MSDHQIVIVRSRDDIRRVLRSMPRRPKSFRRAPTRFPKDIEKVYARELKGEVAIALSLVRSHVLSRIGDLTRQDALIADAVPERLGRAIDEVQIVYGARVAGDGSSKARLAAARTSSESRRQTQRTMQVALGIQPEFTEPWLREETQAFVRRNVRLITNVGEKVFTDVEQAVDRALRQGKRNEELAREIEGMLPDIGDKAERRAELIARDQIGSFFGDLTERRQTDLGILRYRWSTVNDERVRPSHKERDGKVFTWEEPIEAQLEDQDLEVDDIDGPPGIPIQCRCSAIPMIEDLLT